MLAVATLWQREIVRFVRGPSGRGVLVPADNG